jgi:tetratricopeptide (TPR) repeat protein
LVLCHATETRFEAAVGGGEVEDVVLDPEFRVLRWTDRYRREAEAIAPYVSGDIALNYGRNDEARARFEAALQDASSNDEFGVRGLLLRGLGDVASAGRRYDEAVRHYLDALQSTPQWPHQLPELWRALADAYRAQGQTQQADEASVHGMLAIADLHQLARDTL